MAVFKVQTGLRLDEPTYNRLNALAKLESRSLNNLAEYIIKKYLDDYEAKNGSLVIQNNLNQYQ